MTILKSPDNKLVRISVLGICRKCYVTGAVNAFSTDQPDLRREKMVPQ